MPTSHLFDKLATDYDQQFSQTAIGRYLRVETHLRLKKHFQTGDSLLELGCGTGEDTAFLASLGCHVTATDVSFRMLQTAHAKLIHQPNIDFAQLDLSHLSPDWQGGYQGVVANFGVLNCLHDWRPLAYWLAHRIQTGGIAAFGIMPPFCVWEMLWHGVHGDFKTAFRRWRDKTPFQVDASLDSLWITYPTVRQLTRAFAPYFHRIYLRPLGLALPPSDVYGMLAARPAWLQRLLRLDKHLSRAAFLALFADHYWIEFQRNATPTT